MYTVQIKVMPLKELLDPQGKAVMGGLQNLGLSNVEDVRIGKSISLQIDADSQEKAKQIAEEASKKLLANPVMEYFEISTPNLKWALMQLLTALLNVSCRSTTYISLQDRLYIVPTPIGNLKDITLTSTGCFEGS